MGAQTQKGGGGQRVGGPKGGGPKGFAFFFPSPAHHFRFFFSLWGFYCVFFSLSGGLLVYFFLSLGVFSWNSVGVFEGRDPQMCTFGFLGTIWKIFT